MLAAATPEGCIGEQAIGRCGAVGKTTILADIKVQNTLNDARSMVQWSSSPYVKSLLQRHLPCCRERGFSELYEDDR